VGMIKMEKCKSSCGNQYPSFNSLEELIDWAKEKYNATSFPNQNYPDPISLEEIIDWRK